MNKYQRLDNEALLSTYLLIQKDINECIAYGVSYYEMLETSNEIKKEILRRMQNGRH